MTQPLDNTAGNVADVDELLLNMAFRAAVVSDGAVYRQHMQFMARHCRAGVAAPAAVPEINLNNVTHHALHAFDNRHGRVPNAEQPVPKSGFIGNDA